MRGARPRFDNKFDTDRLYAYTRAKNQANHRKESWNLSLEQWFELWDNTTLFYNRGTANHNVVLTRLDPSRPWDVTNVKIMNRTHQQRHRDKIVRERRQELKDKMYAVLQ